MTALGWAMAAGLVLAWVVFLCLPGNGWTRDRDRVRRRRRWWRQ